MKEELDPENQDDSSSADEDSSSDDGEHDYSSNVDLPVFRYKDEIIQACKENQVVIINGETGCGKTTQLPQYLLEAELNNKGTIGITQPRRIAAMSIANRIAKEMNVSLGREVGYQIRFDAKVSTTTKIKVMTEGILLNEFKSDKRLHDYGVIIADEVHERSINSDILLGLLKLVANKRTDLKIIICSATISSEKFSNYFNNARIIKIEGRRFPIEVIYSKCEVKEKYIVEESLKCVKRILENKRGDILIFFPGEDEIVSCSERLESFPNVVILPLYAQIGIEAQRIVLKPVKESYTKIVVATNIAETSITIDGIQFVIDSGYVKESGYKAHLDLQTLDNVLISKAQAEQRKGRAGRTSSGTCYRLYREKDYKKFSNEPIPAIIRENLLEMCFVLIGLGVKPETFGYLDLPSEEKMSCARNELLYLSLVDNDNKLTPLGENVIDLPIELKLGKVIWTSLDKESLFEILCISAMLTERFIFLKSWENRLETERMQDRFNDPDGDLFTLLNLYKEWKEEVHQKSWCRRNFLSLHIMKEIDLIVGQFRTIFTRKYISLNSTFNGNKQEIKKAFLSVFIKNVCFVREDNRVKKATKLFDGQYFQLFPKSSFTKVGNAEVCLFCQAFQTKLKFCNQMISLEPEITKEFEEELKFIGFKEKMENPDLIL